MKTEFEKATARPWKVTEMKYDDCLEIQIGNNQRKVAVTRWEIESQDKINFDFICQAVNEHAALEAVAEAAEKLSAINWYETILAEKLHNELKQALTNLTNLAAVRGQKVEGL